MFFHVTMFVPCHHVCSMSPCLFHEIHTVEPVRGTSTEGPCKLKHASIFISELYLSNLDSLELRMLKFD